MANSEIYKLTSYNEDGKPVVVYVMPQMKRIVAKGMLDEYGDVEEEGMNLADVPEGVLPKS